MAYQVWVTWCHTCWVLLVCPWLVSTRDSLENPRVISWSRWGFWWNHSHRQNSTNAYWWLIPHGNLSCAFSAICLIHYSNCVALLVIHQKDWIDKELMQKANASSVERLHSIIQANSEDIKEVSRSLIEHYQRFDAISNCEFESHCQEIAAMVRSGSNKRTAPPVALNYASKRNNTGSRDEQVMLSPTNILMMQLFLHCPWFTHFSCFGIHEDKMGDVLLSYCEET